MLPHYRALLLMTAIASIIVLLDNLFEPAVLGLFTESHSALGLNVSAPSGTHRQTGLLLATGAASTAKFQAALATLPINHRNPLEHSYQNRYWVNSGFYLPGGPVFVHDAGEVDAESSAGRYLERPTSYLRSLLKEFHGIGIVWEHRYYGKSLPFPVYQNMSFDLFEFLSLEQSLADLPYFAWNLSHTVLPGVDLTPASTPWIMVGCSYSGLRAAFSRVRYPETFHVAYAASAPVQLQVTLNAFFDPIYQKMIDRGYSNCAQDLHAAMSYLDVQLSTPSNAELIKQRLLGPGSEVNSNGDFTLAIANVYSYFQSSGIFGGEYSLESLCTYLEYVSNPAEAKGEALSARYSARSAFERLASWSGLIAIINDHFQTNCGGQNANTEPSCDLGRPDTDINSISWTWQLCSELGLFTTQNSGAHSLVSRYQNLEYRQSLCDRQFPHARSKGFLPPVPTVENINQEMGGRLMRPSNTFWTAGEYDPWRSLTPLAAGPRGVKSSGGISVSHEIPDCNSSTDVDTIFGYVLEDAQHCLDYSTTSKEAETARNYFVQALKKWLPCFEGSKRPRSFVLESP